MNILKNKKSSCFLVFIMLSLLYVQTVWAVNGKSSSTEVQFAAKDGFTITGVIDLPANRSIKSKIPIVIMLHSLGKTRLDWYDFPQKVKGLGVATLVLDMRGHGKSVMNKKGQTRYWPGFQDKEFQKYPDDIISAVNFVRKQYPEVDTARICIVASDVSANASVIAASSLNRNIKTLILLSPTISYKGLDTRIPLVGYGNHPVLIFASQRDRDVYYDSSELIKFAQGVKVLKAYPSGGNGMDLLRSRPDSQTMILNWISMYLLNKK
jgi:predicted esterase